MIFKSVIRLLLIFMFSFLVIFPSFSAVENIDYGIEKVTSTGLGNDVNTALKNAEISALESVIFTLVQTDEEKNSYQTIKNKFVEDRKNYVKMIKIVGKKSTDAGREITVNFEIDKGKLKNDLVDLKIISSVKKLSESLGNPKIMAFYYERDNKDQYSKWAIARANDYLLRQGFKVVDEETILNLRNDDKFISKLGGRDAEQEIAVQTSADIYMSLKIQLREAGKSGDYTYMKTPVEVDAFYSNSGEQFIKKLYRRLNKDGEEEALAIKGDIDTSAKVVIEEAVAGVMKDVTNDLLLKWKNSIKDGMEYSILVKGLDDKKLATLTSYLKSVCLGVDLKNGKYTIKYKGKLITLIDEIEEKYEDSLGLSLLYSNSKEASFTKKK